MSFNSKEKVIAYLSQALNHFKVNEFSEIVPEIFQMPHSFFEDKVQHMKVKWNTKNLTEILLLEINKTNWKVMDILLTSFYVELEDIIRHSNRFEWTANKFLGTINEEDIDDLGKSVEAAVRDDGKDALVLFKKVENFFFFSIVMKNLKKIGIYEKPRYMVVSCDKMYFFTKDKRSLSVVEYVMSVLGHEKCKRIKLCGKSLPSLLKLLKKRETADPKNQPVYEEGNPFESIQGFDFTQKKNILDFYDKCFDSDITLQHYTVTSVDCPWMGDDNSYLRQMEFKSAVTLSGDVVRIIKNMTMASIVKPPLPDYLQNFSIKGRNSVLLKPTYNRLA